MTSADSLLPGKHLIRLTLFFWLGLLPLQSLMAQNTYDLDDLEDGQLLLNLSISETAEVEQDLLVAVLQFMVRGPDSTALQREVNQAMTKALDSLRGKEGIDYQTQQYHVRPLHSQHDGPETLENPIWQAQQSLQLSGQDSVAVLAAVTQLQAQGLGVQQLSYSLSPGNYRKFSASLLETAISNLQGSAQRSAELLGKQHARIIELSLNESPNHGMRSRFMAAANADSAQMVTPVAEPGTTTVTVSVSARVLIGP